MSEHRRSWVAVALFVVAVAVLVLAGRGELAAPPLRGFSAWADERGPVVAAVALLRLAALGAASWSALAAVVSITAVIPVVSDRPLGRGG